MRIHKLVLENYRAFDRCEISFEPGFNLIVGDNGAGKTAILDGLAVAVGSLFLGVDGVRPSAIARSDVRLARFEHQGLPEVHPQYPCSVGAVGWFEGWLLNIDGDHEVKAAWSRSLNSDGGRTTSRDAATVRRAGERLLEQVRSGAPASLPVLAYYGTGRLWVFKRDLADKVLGSTNRLDGYLDCLDPASNQKQIVEWLKRQALVKAQKRIEIPHVSAIEAAVKRCVPALAQFYFDLQYNELRLEFDDGRLMPFDALSDGYRNTVAMIADIAWRASVLNPHLGAQGPRSAVGVVLIDELDLHLHPKWQRRIIADLRAAFPKIQFIATTHSPFVIQALEDGHLIDLSEPKGADWRRRSIEDIAEDIQGVPNPQRSQRFEQMTEVAERYYRLLGELRDASDDRVTELRRDLDALMERFADDPAYVAMLKMERTAAEAKRGPG